MRIAVIGSGISGLTAAYLLSKKHEVVLYEASDRIGGHTATMDINHKGRDYKIDTGFIVFNDWTYPYFQKLMAQLNVESQKTDMGFSVSCDKTGLEYSGNDLNTMFAQRKNIFSPNHWRMIRDILRFNKEAPIDLAKKGSFLTMTLGEYLQEKNYSSVFVDKYLIPMGSAIWSASTSAMKGFPLQFFVNFFINHGLLSVNDRPQWHVIKGGSKSYIEPLIATFKDKIRLNSPVTSVIRNHKKLNDIAGELRSILVEDEDGCIESYEHVVIATHSDQALALLSDADDNEKGLLDAIKYRNNEVVLHTDEALLPKNKRTWSSWNYRIESTSNDENTLPVLTYNMNILQGIEAPHTFCVTLNNTSAIDQSKILGVYQYAHPIFTADAVAAQQRWEEINAHNNTWFCGAYWANGFHEDGVKSAVRIAEKFGISL